MFPESLMSEEWQMTESHNFPPDAQFQGMVTLDIYHAGWTQERSGFQKG